jgi:hypothetical protein
MRAPFQGFPPALLAQIAQAAFRPPQAMGMQAPGMQAPQQQPGGDGGMGGLMAGLPGLSGGLAGLINGPGGFGGAGGAANSPAAAHGMQVGSAGPPPSSFWSWLPWK